MAPENLPPLAEASALHERYARAGDGSIIPQSSAPAIVAAMLAMAELEPGQSVLEIGTGSGYSTALIAAAVGVQGAVVSLDVEAHLVAAAAAKLRADGFARAVVLRRDGREGAAARAPFDRVLAWTNPGRVPHAWVDQTKPDGLLVVPVTLAPVALATAIVRLRRTREGSLAVEALRPGGFVPMHAPGRTSWRGPAEEAGMSWDNGQGWLSAPWLGALPAGDRAAIRDGLIGAPLRPGLLRPEEDAEAFAAYLLAARPREVVTAARRAFGPAVGVRCGPTAVALQGLATSGALTTAPGGLECLDSAVSAWRRRGRPGLPHLPTRVRRTDAGWEVRLAG